MSATRTLIAGIGSPHGDDRLGWSIVDQLRLVTLPKSVELRKAQAPIELMNWLPEDRLAGVGFDRLIVCDACLGLGPPGTVAHWLWPATELERIRWSGSHDFSPGEVLTLAARLDRLPARTDIWAIEGRRAPVAASAADTESPASAAVAQVAERIAHDCCNASPISWVSGPTSGRGARNA